MLIFSAETQIEFQCCFNYNKLNYASLRQTEDILELIRFSSSAFIVWNRVTKWKYIPDMDAGWKGSNPPETFPAYTVHSMDHNFE